MASVEVKGLPELLKKFAELEEMVAQLSAPTAEALSLLLERMQFYPAPPPNSTYERTGDLKASWQQTLIISSSSLTGRVFTNIPYGPYVQDEENQAGIHQGRWQTVQSVVKEEEGNILNLYEQHLEQLLNKPPKGV